MIERPLISICIPAYKRIEFLDRLLKSISIQNFRSFEVVITDDSPDDDVRKLCESYSSQFPITYHRNIIPLGTPENWNEAIRRATGSWIKLMHDDDWFALEGNLSVFADGIEKNPAAGFFFSAYTNYYESGEKEEVFLNDFRKKMLLKNPVTLFSTNVIGPPSVTLHKNDEKGWYDKTVKWVVDIDFYIRALKKYQPVYIDTILVNVGLGKHQVTIDCARQRPVEIPENFYLLNKVGVGHLSNIHVYDGWWRLMRNLEIDSPDDIRSSGYQGPIPPVILSMIRWQHIIGRRLLRIGLLSKIIMTIHYILRRSTISKRL